MNTLHKVIKANEGKIKDSEALQRRISLLLKQRGYCAFQMIQHFIDIGEEQHPSSVRRSLSNLTKKEDEFGNKFAYLSSIQLVDPETRHKCKMYIFNKNWGKENKEKPSFKFLERCVNEQPN